jgi:hypothetical protein
VSYYQVQSDPTQKIVMMSDILTSKSAKVMILLSLFCFVRISAAAIFPQATVIN